MQRTKERLKQITPRPVWKLASDSYWWWFNRGRHALSAAFSPLRRESARRMRAYKDRYVGKRCFILGNGPSLRETDLSLLEGEITFGLNRIYLLFPELGFPTSFLVSVNTLVIEQCREDFQELEVPKFITWRGRRWMADDPQAIFIDTDYTQPETFSEDATGRLYEGCTVTYIALQLAFYMGFQQAILIGVDHHFTTKGQPNEEVVSTGEDPNHFHPGYFGEGFRWQLPDLECAERAYSLANEAYRMHGREVIDATIGGKLEVFPKMDYLNFFKDSES